MCEPSDTAYLAHVRENGVNGNDLLTLTDEDFEQELGLKRLQVRKLKAGIAEMQLVFAGGPGVDFGYGGGYDAFPTGGVSHPLADNPYVRQFTKGGPGGAAPFMGGDPSARGAPPPPPSSFGRPHVPPPPQQQQDFKAAPGGPYSQYYAKAAATARPPQPEPAPVPSSSTVSPQHDLPPGFTNTCDPPPPDTAFSTSYSFKPTESFKARRNSQTSNFTTVEVSSQDPSPIDAPTPDPGAHYYRQSAVDSNAGGGGDGSERWSSGRRDADDGLRSETGSQFGGGNFAAGGPYWPGGSTSEEPPYVSPHTGLRSQDPTDEEFSGRVPPRSDTYYMTAPRPQPANPGYYRQGGAARRGASLDAGDASSFPHPSVSDRKSFVFKELALNQQVP